MSFDQYLKRFPWLKVYCNKILRILRSKLIRMKQLIERNKNSGKQIIWQNHSEKYVSDGKLNCGKHMNEYLESTSLHGLKYVGLTQITLLER